MKPKHLWGLLASVGLLLSLQALWMPAKAELGQFLLAHNWQRVLQGEPASSPWPGADMQVVARLEVPAMGIDQLIVNGQQGAQLAWAPGMVSAAIPGLSDTVISAHRDSHFGFLKELSKGDLIRLQTSTGEFQYRISTMQIVDSSSQQLQLDVAGRRLVLTTCYPFDALQTGSPLRYMVTAVAVTTAANRLL